MDIKIWKNLGQEEKKRLLSRSATDIQEALGLVAPIVEAVRQRGDAALREYTLTLDRVDLKDLPLAVGPEEFEKAEKALDSRVKEALRYAIGNVIAFHERQAPGPMSFEEIRPGLFAGEKPLPLPSAGLYVPRGRGSFPSMLYMLAVPAVIAGVREIRIVTPPNADGSIDAACLFTVKTLSEEFSLSGRGGREADGPPSIEIFRVGGAQAAAALAFGTESIARVVKLVGPGSRYVSAAKQLLAAYIDTGLPAGPSEAIVLADGTTDSRLVVQDLLIEAEHGSDSSAILVTTDEKTARDATRLLPSLIEALPEPRRSFARDVFSGYGCVILAENTEEAAAIVNSFAPEHLQIHAREPLLFLPYIKNAGEILLGETTPFSLANYACGVNAVLPTGGRAAAFSAVSVRDFIKYSSVVHVSSRGFDALRDKVITLAKYEGFPAHAEALRNRGQGGGPLP